MSLSVILRRAALCLVLAAPAALPAFPTSAVAQEATPGQLAAAKDALISSGIGRSFEVIVPQLMVRLEQTLNRTRPEIAKDLAATLNQLEPEFMKNQDEILTTAARIMAKRMSEQELKDVAAFFKSPPGKKYVDSQPAMLDELVVAIQGWSEKISQTMMGRVREEMKKKGHDI